MGFWRVSTQLHVLVWINNRDIDRYHWSSEKFLSLWRTKFSVLMARERGRIGADAALGDIPKRLWAHAFDEMDDGPAR